MAPTAPPASKIATIKAKISFFIIIPLSGVFQMRLDQSLLGS